MHISRTLRVLATSAASIGLFVGAATLTVAGTADAKKDTGWKDTGWSIDAKKDTGWKDTGW